MRIATSLIAILVAACGGVNGFPDATTSDGKSFDAAPTFDANPRGLVKVTVLDLQSGAPITGAQVVFTEPGGAVAARVATNGQGKAEAEVLPDTSVTAVYLTGGNSHEMHTITGAKPGDDLVFTGSLDYSVAGTFTVNWPTYPNASYYYVITACGYQYTPGNTNQLQVQLYGYCKPETTMSVGVIAYDQQGNQFYLDRANVNVAAGATSLSGSYASPQNYTANFTNVPAEVTYVNHNRVIPAVPGWSTGNGGAPTTGTASMSFTTPVAVSAVAQSRFERGTYQIQQRVVQPIAGNALTYNFDVGTQLLPWVLEPTLDLSTGVIKSQTEGSGTGDLYRVTVGYQRTNGNTTDYYRWVVYAPTAMDVTLPQLPPELGDLNPKTTDILLQYQAEAALGEADVITSYDQIRNHVEQLYLATMSPFGDSMLGPNTQLVRVSYFTASD